MLCRSIFLSVCLLLAPTAAFSQASAAAKTAPKEDTQRELVVFGDSLSAGYGLPAGKSYPDDLQRKFDTMHNRWRVVNMSISGDTTMGGVARMNTAVAVKPELVLLELGGNDGLRGMPLARTRENLEKMIAEFQRVGARVVLAGMTLPPNYGPDYVSGFEKIYTDLAAKYKLTLIPFLLSDIITSDMRYFQRDGVHPTAEGAEVVANTVMRVIQPLLR